MNFDRLASHYDWLETFTAGDRLQVARAFWLEKLTGCCRILSAGEGHGRFVAACAARFPDAEITCVEASPQMLRQAKRRLLDSGANIHWHSDDVRNWKPEGKYNAVVTCFLLDCFQPDELAEVVAKLAASATEDAFWLVVDFAVPPRGLARWRAQVVHALMYAFFRCVAALPARRLTPPDDLLRAQGFALIYRREFEWGLIRADLWRRCSEESARPLGER